MELGRSKTDFGPIRGQLSPPRFAREARGPSSSFLVCRFPFGVGGFQKAKKNQRHPSRYNIVALSLTIPGGLFCYTGSGRDDEK